MFSVLLLWKKCFYEHKLPGFSTCFFFFLATTLIKWSTDARQNMNTDIVTDLKLNADNLKKHVGMVAEQIQLLLQHQTPTVKPRRKTRVILTFLTPS